MLCVKTTNDMETKKNVVHPKNPCHSDFLSIRLSLRRLKKSPQKPKHEDRN